MIPLTTLNDEYIDRPKLSEQKKPFEYIVPPSPLKVGVGTIYFRFDVSIPFATLKTNILMVEK